MPSLLYKGKGCLTIYFYWLGIYEIHSLGIYIPFVFNVWLTIGLGPAIIEFGRILLFGVYFFANCSSNLEGLLITCFCFGVSFWLPNHTSVELYYFIGSLYDASYSNQIAVCL